MSGSLKKVRIKLGSFSKRLFKPHPHKRIDHLSKSVHGSFTNLRKDMEHVSKLLHHYDSKFMKNEKQFEMLEKRIKVIETIIHKLQIEKDVIRMKKKKEEVIEEAQEEIESPKPDYESLFTNSLWESLTETQQKLCWKLAALQKEMPKQWLSMKYLAQEIYPDKEYNLVRSTISQFITGLEELGIVKRKRKGKQAYILSTDKNPCKDKKIPFTVDLVDKKKAKNKQQ